jgi:2-aminoadipate transaminase
MNTVWSQQLSSGARKITSSAIRDLLKVTEQADIISFAGGLPAPECFPTEELHAAAERVLIEQPQQALQYGPTEGLQPLRGFVAERMAQMGLHVPLEQVVVTSGSQQALDLLGKLFIDPGATVIVEQPTYMGALQAWQPYQPSYITIPLDEEGLDIQALAQVLEQGARPRFLYIVSCFQNPTGITLSPARRLALIQLAAQYNLPIVEDDPYGELYYAGERPPTLAALDCAIHGELRHVLYLSTFSKLLAPGLRVGWMAAPEEIVRKFVHAKQGTDLHSSSLSQAIAYEACKDGLLDRHIPTIRAIYHARRDAMLEALEASMPKTVRWTHPAGGMFIWLTLPVGVNTTNVLRVAVEQRVVFVPGAAFFANGGGENTMRLNFSHSSPERIREGVARLAEVLAAFLAEQRND